MALQLFGSGDLWLSGVSAGAVSAAGTPVEIISDAAKLLGKMVQVLDTTGNPIYTGIVKASATKGGSLGYYIAPINGVATFASDGNTAMQALDAASPWYGKGVTLAAATEIQLPLGLGNPWIDIPGGAIPVGSPFTPYMQISTAGSTPAVSQNVRLRLGTTGTASDSIVAIGTIAAAGLTYGTYSYACPVVWKSDTECSFSTSTSGLNGSLVTNTGTATIDRRVNLKLTAWCIAFGVPSAPMTVSVLQLAPRFCA